VLYSLKFETDYFYIVRKNVGLSGLDRWGHYIITTIVRNKNPLGFLIPLHELVMLLALSDFLHQPYLLT
jgi:hypothetical protein